MKRTKIEADTPVGGYKRRRGKRGGKKNSQRMKKAEEADREANEKADPQLRLDKDEVVALRTPALTSSQILFGPNLSTEAVTNKATTDGDTTDGFATDRMEAITLDPDAVDCAYNIGIKH